MSDLDGYQVTFKQDPTLGWWTYEIETPDGRTMRPVMGVSIKRESCEAQALRRIEADLMTGTMSGAELAARVRGRTKVTPEPDRP